MLEHERRHVAISRDMIEEAAGAIERRLEKLKGTLARRTDEDLNAATQAIREEVSKTVAATFDEVHTRFDERQKAFDEEEARRGYFGDRPC